MKERNTWFLPAIPRRRARRSYSPSASGSASGSRRRIEAGMVSSMSWSRLPSPSAESISATSASLGPMWRDGNVSEAAR
jgi:hypothetical protein